MKLGLGHLKIAPRDFWAYSAIEWLAAVDGYRESLGAEGPGEKVTREDLDHLEDLYEQQMRGASNDRNAT